MAGSDSQDAQPEPIDDQGRRTGLPTGGDGRGMIVGRGSRSAGRDLVRAGADCRECLPVMTALTVQRLGQATRAYYESTGRDPRPVLPPPRTVCRDMQPGRFEGLG